LDDHPLDDHGAIKQRLLDAALPKVAFDGWSARTLTRAANDAGVSGDDLLLACPRGAIDLVEFWVARADREMLAGIAPEELAAMKVRERVATLVRRRLEPLLAHKEAVRGAMGLLALPANAGLALKQLYRTVDAIWYAAGDTATDWNFYSKRALLAGVYSAALLYWLNDRSEGAADTWRFLDRRLDDVMKLQGVTARVRKLGEKLPDPFQLLRRAQGRA
jgi:ubiquinone biosynthesis protein COQ9